MMSARGRLGAVHTPSGYAQILMLVSIAMVGAFYCSTIRAGHDWGDDFSLYILHAKNIVEGKEYVSTGFLHNPLHPEYSPEAYPPIFPVILAPLYHWRGLDFAAMKVVVIFFFLAFLAVFSRTCRDQLSAAYAIGLVLLIGFNPYFWSFKDSILAEFPFLFFIYTALYFIQRHYDRPLGAPASVGLPTIILAAAFIYMAFGTRTLGAVLVPSLMMYDIIRTKRVSSFAVMAGGLSLLLIGAQTLLLPAGRGFYLALYNTHLDESFFTLVFSNVIAFGSELPTIWGNGYSRLIRNGLFVVVSAFAMIGLWRRVGKGATVYEWFFLFYLGAILMWPLPFFRYLMPILPLYFLYAATGLREVWAVSRWTGWTYAPIIVGLVIALSYAGAYLKMDFGPIRVGIARPEAQELFRYIREHTQPRDIIICRKPRAMALLTERRASIYPLPSPDIESGYRIAWTYFHDIGATYLILDTFRNAQGNRESVEIDWLLGLTDTYQTRLEQVFSNEDFAVYKIHDA